MISLSMVFNTTNEIINILYYEKKIDKKYKLKK